MLDNAGGILFVLGSQLGAVMLVRKQKRGACSSMERAQHVPEDITSIGFGTCSKCKPHQHRIVHVDPPLMQIVFLGLVTPVMHDFWHQKDGSDAQVLQYSISTVYSAVTVSVALHQLVTEIEPVDLATQW